MNAAEPKLMDPEQKKLKVSTIDTLVECGCPNQIDSAKRCCAFDEREDTYDRDLDEEHS